MVADVFVKLSDVEEMLASAGMVSDGEYSGYITEDVRLNDLPTFEAELITHGHWIHNNGNTICSRCRSKELGDRPRCSVCGAWMDETDGTGALMTLQLIEQDKLSTRARFFKAVKMEDDGRQDPVFTRDEFLAFQKTAAIGRKDSDEQLDDAVLIYSCFEPFHDVNYVYSPSTNAIYEHRFYIGD